MREFYRKKEGNTIKEKEFRKTFFWLAAIAVALAGFIILRPYFNAILGSAVLAYIFFPLYRVILKKIRREPLAAMLTTAIVVILLLLPLFFILNALSKEAYIGYIVAKQKISSTEFLLPQCGTKDIFCQITSSINNFLAEPKIRYQLQTGIEKSSAYIITSISNLLLSIPRFILNVSIIIFGLYYMFKDGKRGFSLLASIAPLSEIYKKHLFEKMGKVTYAIIYGYILVALIQGILAALGFYIFGIHSPLILGIVVAFLALIPILGPSLVWVPAALFKLLDAISASNQSEIMLTILFALYCLIFVSSLETFLKTKLIGDKAQVHPLIILIGVLGGLSVLGFVGIVIGPLILALTFTFFKLYQTDKRILE
ncbi:AI-2E family transporter [Candidatus Woesearchaeota archaeon]|nr:AI-2E family transporter [Candidatus Woesearchaeota archaeon]